MLCSSWQGRADVSSSRSREERGLDNSQSQATSEGEARKYRQRIEAEEAEQQQSCGLGGASLPVSLSAGPALIREPGPVDSQRNDAADEFLSQKCGVRSEKFSFSHFSFYLDFIRKRTEFFSIFHR